MSVMLLIKSGGKSSGTGQFTFLADLEYGYAMETVSPSIKFTDSEQVNVAIPGDAFVSSRLR